MNIFFTNQKEYYAFTHQESDRIKKGKEYYAFTHQEESDRILLTLVKTHGFSNYSS